MNQQVQESGNINVPARSGQQQQQQQQQNVQEEKKPIYIFYIIFMFLVALLFFIFFYYIKRNYSNPGFALEKKPLSDINEYFAITLQNDINLLFVSSPTTSMSGACVQVKVGSMNDPDFMPGMSNFLKHILYLGSRNYPEEDSFEQFVMDNGGNLSGHTELSYTNFNFIISTSEFLEALKMFSRFFIDPLLNPNELEKEVTAITSEYLNSLYNPKYRIQSILKILANQRHPFAKFSIGNNYTLLEQPELQGLNPRQEIRRYYKTQYSGNRMDIIVYSQSSLIQHNQDIIMKYFMEITNKKLPPLNYSKFGEPFDTTKTGKIIKIKSNIHAATTTLVFNTPYLQDDKHKSIKFIKQMLELLTNPSFCEKLEIDQLATECSIEYESLEQISFIWKIKFMLTIDGMRFFHRVFLIFFSYIQLIQEQGIQVAHYQQLAEFNEAQFNYQEMDHSLLKEIQHLAGKINRNLNQNLLFQSQNFSKFDQVEINTVLKGITPENLIIIVEGMYNSDYDDEGDDQDDLNDGEGDQDNNKTQVKAQANNEQNFIQINKKNRPKIDFSWPDLSSFDNSTFNTNQEHQQKKKHHHKQDQAINQQEQQQIVNNNQQQNQNSSNSQQNNTNNNSNSSNTQQNQNNQKQILAQINQEKIKISKEEMPAAIELNQFMAKASNFQRNSLYHLDYIMHDLSKETLNIFKSQANFSQYNLSILNQTSQFIPKNITVNTSPFSDGEIDPENPLDDYVSYIQNPVILKQNDHGYLWYMFDNSFRIPKVHVFLKFESQNKIVNPSDQLCGEIFSLTLQNSLMMKLKNFVFSGLQYSISFNKFGLIIKYVCLVKQNDNILKIIINTLQELQYNQDIVEFLVEKLIIKYESEKQDLLYRQAQRLLQSILDDTSFRIQDLLDEIDNLQYNQVEQYFKKFKQQLRLEAFFYGTLEKYQAESSYNYILKTMNFTALPSDQKVSFKVLNFKKDPTTFRTYYSSADKENVVTMNYYQSGKRNTKSYGMLQLLIPLIRDKANDYLHKQLQLGYIASASLFSIGDVDGIIIYVQGFYERPDKIDFHIEELLEIIEQHLNNLKEEQFEEIKKATKSQIIPNFIRMGDKAQTFWNQIEKNSYEFYLDECLDQTFSQISLSDLKQFYRDWLEQRAAKFSLQLYNPAKQGNYEINQKNALDEMQTYHGKNDKLILDEKLLEEYPIYKVRLDGLEEAKNACTLSLENPDNQL